MRRPQRFARIGAHVAADDVPALERRVAAAKLVVHADLTREGCPAAESYDSCTLLEALVLDADMAARLDLGAADRAALAVLAEWNDAALPDDLRTARSAGVDDDGLDLHTRGSAVARDLRSRTDGALDTNLIDRKLARSHLRRMRGQLRHRLARTLEA